jgi:hypothetical protein
MDPAVEKSWLGQMVLDLNWKVDRIEKKLKALEGRQEQLTTHVQNIKDCICFERDKMTQATTAAAAAARAAESISTTVRFLATELPKLEEKFEFHTRFESYSLQGVSDYLRELDDKVNQILWDVPEGCEADRRIKALEATMATQQQLINQLLDKISK